MADEVHNGRVAKVMGPVVDVEFAAGHLPDLNNAITIDLEEEHRSIHLTLEAAQHLGNDIVRCVALGSTDGLARGLTAVDTGGPISVPVGRCVLGRIFNVLGETIDGREPVAAQEKRPIHRLTPGVQEVEPADEVLETGIKVVDLLAPYPRGGKIGLFGGAGVGAEGSLSLRAEGHGADDEGQVVIADAQVYLAGDDRPARILEINDVPQRYRRLSLQLVEGRHHFVVGDLRFGELADLLPQLGEEVIFVFQG